MIYKKRRKKMNDILIFILILLTPAVFSIFLQIWL
jgi:hypothetical protein